MKIVNGRLLRVEPSGAWNQGGELRQNRKGLEFGADKEREPVATGKRRVGERAYMGKDGRKVEKWTGFSHFETVLIRLFPDVSTQVVDFPRICNVRLFGEGMEFEIQSPALWPSSGGTQWVGLRSLVVSASTNLLRHRKLYPAVAENQPVVLERFKKYHSRSERAVFLDFGVVSAQLQAAVGMLLRQSLAKIQKSSLRTATLFLKTLQTNTA
jgi:hypothetical protein